MQVQNGCDHRCTFCIIPFGRGNSRSVPMGEVVTQARRLAAHGYREVVLTGVDITSYGADLPGAPRLGALVSACSRTCRNWRGCGCPRSIRSRPTAICSTRSRNEPRLMPHLHLSLQAGDDLILKRMKRRHTRADAIAFCDQVRRLRPDIVFGADIIAGFPTETEEMFARSLDLVETAGSRICTCFRSRRGPARRPRACRSSTARSSRSAPAFCVRRAKPRLRAVSIAKSARGGSVLAERGGVGHTEQFMPVRLASPIEPGRILDLTMAGHDGRQLLAA